MPQRTLEITPEIVVDILKGLQGLNVRRFEVVENALPDDAEFVQAKWAGNGNIAVVIDSPQFEESGMPLKGPMLRVVYD